MEQETDWNAEGVNFSYLKVANESRKPSLVITSERGKIKHGCNFYESKPKN